MLCCTESCIGAITHISWHKEAYSLLLYCLIMQLCQWSQKDSQDCPLTTAVASGTYIKSCDFSCAQVVASGGRAKQLPWKSMPQLLPARFNLERKHATMPLFPTLAHIASLNLIWILLPKAMCNLLFLQQPLPPPPHPPPLGGPLCCHVAVAMM